MIDSGYYASFMVNTKGKGYPKYIAEFLASLSEETGNLFLIKAVFNQTANMAMWRAQYPNIKHTDSLLQFVCTLNVELSESDFCEYFTTIIKEDLIPFSVGCGFDLFCPMFSYEIPPEYKGIALGGEKSVSIKMDCPTQSISKILGGVFVLTPEQVADKVEELVLNKEIILSNCLTEPLIPKFLELMEKACINCTII